jgi:shikimate dehydrogenase
MRPRVDGSTRVYAVLGHPVSHSLSPRMHNAAFDAIGMNAIFVALDVAPEGLEPVLRGLHAAGVAGLSVTLPLKEPAWELAVARTETARRAGAVNALAWTEGGYRGHATDGPGFLAWLRELGLELRGRRVILVGAGGAARSLMPELAGAGVGALAVVSRNAARAAALAGVEPAAALRPIAAALCEAPPSGPAAWDLLVRAISGPEEALAGGEERWWSALAPDGVILDLNYGPRSATARARAAAMGKRYEDGLGLLLHQGALSFEFWTERPAPLEAMRESLAAP